jgi:maleylpyruvate isomerase
MRLYEGWRSSASWRVRWALALKKVAYDSVLIDVELGDQHTILAPKNPMHQVPTLELDDGQLLTESVAIIEWLEDTYPDPALLPRGPLERARVRELVQIINSGVQPLQNTIVRKAISSEPGEQRAWVNRWIGRGLSAYESHVGGHAGRFSLGDRLTMADLYLVPQVRNALRHGSDISACTRVLAIYDACMQLPEVKASDPEVVKRRAQ